MNLVVIDLELKHERLPPYGGKGGRLGLTVHRKSSKSSVAMFRFWTKPHFIAVDEPTNYLDVETVEALSKVGSRA